VYWDKYQSRKWNVYLAVFDIGLVSRHLSDKINGTDISEIIRLRDEEMSPEGRTCYAKLPISIDGHPIFNELSVSSLPWALGRVHQSTLESLCAETFEQAAEDLRHQMESCWSCLEDPKLSPEFLSQLVNILVEWAGFPVTLTSPAWVDVVGKLPKKSKKPSEVVHPESDNDEEADNEPPPVTEEMPILNSFFYHDLKLAKLALSHDSAVNPLRKYLQGDEVEKLDLESPAGEQHIRDSLTPEAFNSGRWPSEPQELQSLMQQYALNKLRTLEDGEILSVNGPPGTGKTTLLRDLIADLVIRRAQAMAKLSNPKDGISKQSVNIDFGNGTSNKVPILNAELTGYEIVVCSTNNGAVENLSLELPQQERLAEQYRTSLRYFQPVATKYAGTQKDLSWKTPTKPVWGLISAALGKSANRKRFGDIFGYRSPSPDDGPGEQFLGKDKVKHQDWEARGAIDFWRFRATQGKATPNFAEAKRRFKQAQQQYAEYSAQLTRLRQQWLEFLPQWQQACAEISSLPPLDADTSSKELLEVLDLKFSMLARRQTELEQKLGPAWLRWLLKWFRRDQHRLWLAARQQTLRVQDLKDGLRIINRLLEKCGPIQLCDGKSLDNHRNQEKTFWQGPDYNRHRNELFVAAMELHQAFVLEAATSATVFALGNLLSKRVSSGPATVLWQWLFLLTPVVSSTFASVHNQFRGVAPGSLGWMIVDEAGQAVPQAAVGAILRAKRLVVVGDPLQIEPVVTMPSKLIELLGEYWLKEKAPRYAVHQHSVQTLADRAHGYGVRHPHNENDFIGIPLVMHRRCDNPMFDIANVIAYRNRMWHAKKRDSTTPHPILGVSDWWNVAGSASDSKYVEAQGERVFEALLALYLANVAEGDDSLPQAYVITPFREVKQGLLKLLLNPKQWQKRLAEFNVPPPSNLADWHANIGTVHTFQGKEADIVFFVLGCDETRMGAIGWAASKPNLLNVAVTRAKNYCYIIGDKSLWGNQPYFDVAAAKLNQPA